MIDTMTSLSELKQLDAGPMYLYVLTLPPSLTLQESNLETLAVPVISRQNGVMLAVPSAALPDAFLSAGVPGISMDLVGPSKKVQIPAMVEEADGAETPIGIDLDITLVDFHSTVISHLRLFDPVTDSQLTPPFLAGSPEALPQPSLLLAAAYEWIQMGHEEGTTDRIYYYTADEAEVVDSGVPVQPTSRAPKKTPQKRVTAASKAEQVSGLAQVLPNLTQQLVALQDQQKRLETIVMEGTTKMQTPAHQLPFATPPRLPGTASAQGFMAQVGPPPRTRASALRQPKGERESPQLMVPGEEPMLVPSEEGYLDQLAAASGMPKPDHITQLLFQQSQALTTLVSHIAAQDGGLDFGGGSSSSSSLSLKGSSKREKLLSELASRKSSFMLLVAQNAFRRLKPAEPLPATLQDFNGKPIFTKYLEKHGAFNGSRDLGLAMWLIAHVADQMVQGDQKGAEEMLALALVSIEQASQDGNKWEVAWLLSLQEEPPPSLFATRPPATNPRLRAFSPLCPPEWAATTLSYVKELDIINNRRSEALPGRKGNPKEDDKPAAKPKPKKPPRFPKKPKDED